PPSKGLHVALWSVQWLLAVTFVGTAAWKLLTPISTLAAAMPWMGQVAPPFLHLTALVDLLGGLGVVLPSLTRIVPRLTSLAALGCAALQLGAIAFHVSRDEAGSTPFNALLVGLSLFVAWGRRNG
ncbi:MAG: DoxX family protein, partial [Archangium sp.]|nr:DoxX family protein [Archangium sp.]